MKTITVSAREKTLNDMLKKAQRNGLILQAANGKRFILTSIENWVGFNVGAGDDFAQEVKMTTQNEKLMAFLTKRRSHAKRLPLATVKEQLGLN